MCSVLVDISINCITYIYIYVYFISQWYDTVVLIYKHILFASCYSYINKLVNIIFGEIKKITVEAM